jgi:hypothetical protein
MADVDPEVGEVLTRVITEALGGPRGDPDFHHHMAAAGAFRALKMLGLPFVNTYAENYEESLRRTLRNITVGGTGDDPGGNIYETDFLTEVGWPPEMDGQSGRGNA